MFVEKESLKQYKSEVDRFPLLSVNETNYLLKKYKESNDQEAFNKLVKHNLRLSEFVALKFVHKCTSMTLLDLIQENTLVLMSSIKNFDISKNVKFPSYVVSCMEKSLQRTIDQKNENIKIPKEVMVAFRKYLKYIYKYTKENYSMPSNEEIKKEIGLEEDVLKFMEKLKNYSTISLNRKITLEDGENDYLINNIPDNIEVSSKAIDNLETKVILKSLQEHLKSEEYYTVYYRVFFKPSKTFSKIGEELETTKTNISKKENRAFRKLAHTLEEIKQETLEKYSLYYLGSLDLKSFLPLSPKMHALMHHLKEELSDLQYCILYDWIYKIEDDSILSYHRLYPSLSKKQLTEEKKFLSELCKDLFNEENLLRNYQLYRDKYSISALLDLNILPKKEEKYHNINKEKNLTIA